MNSFRGGAGTASQAAARGARVAGLVVVGAGVAAALTACAPARAASGDGAGGAGRPTASASPESAVDDLNAAPGSASRTSTSRASASGASTSRASTTHATSHASGSAGTGPRIVSFTVAQQPKCPEGTAVFRAPAVPLKISWKVSGATGVALSVDNPGLVGSYGTYKLEGTLEFVFSCGGPVGSVETHRYTIVTVGGGEARRAEVSASAKVMDAGPRTG